ncbi:hypothetical protein JOE31_002746 [Arthrobacter sp. PvP023]|uniref:hypothetical protein n=1 Tax=Micrococcaceae TaxID=1268 RepID=UPI001AEA0712|nr:hypothetical protein [Arthrobacter sp. PvP023]MBP1136514.1 hypothetical protein [Arthrobacter sp. PvP023]
MNQRATSCTSSGIKKLLAKAYVWLGDAEPEWQFTAQNPPALTSRERINSSHTEKSSMVREALQGAGIDEPMDRVLLGQTHGGPQWSRVEWAQQLLLHAYTHSNTKHSAPILTAIAFVNWWEGRGSKAHQFLQLALEAS